MAQQFGRRQRIGIGIAQLRAIGEGRPLADAGRLIDQSDRKVTPRKRIGRGHANDPRPDDQNALARAAFPSTNIRCHAQHANMWKSGSKFHL